MMVNLGAYWKRYGGMVLCVWLLASCAVDENFLSGSISEGFDLSFDYVEIKRDQAMIEIFYQDDISFPEIDYQGTNTILQLTDRLIPETADLNRWLDVTDVIELRRYVLVMTSPYDIVQDDRTFPLLNMAQINFTVLDTKSVDIVKGRPVKGQFYLVFSDGSTMRGGFSGSQ